MAAGLLLAGALAAPAAPSGPAACTIEGTRGKDRLVGTDGPDVICAGKGRDRIKSGAGDDLIRSGRGRDRVKAGDGDDRLSGGRGDDHLYGEEDDDVLIGGPGDNVLDAGPGVNQCSDGGSFEIRDGVCYRSIVVERLLVTPEVVDTSKQPQRIAVELTAQDIGEPGESAPIDERVIELRVLHGLHDSEGSHPYFAGAQLKLVAGDRSRATWSGQIDLPSQMPHRRYPLFLIFHGSATVESWAFTWDALEAAGAPGWIDQEGPGDDARPVLTDLQLSAQEIDTSESSQDVSVELTATDDLSGVREVEIGWREPDGSHFLSGMRPASAPSDDKWVGRLYFPQGSPPRRYELVVRLGDRWGAAVYDAPTLQAMGLPSYIEQVGQGEAEP